MYETPKLIEVGKAEDVILGIVPTGEDMDLNYMIPEIEWAEDWFNPPSTL